MPSASALGIAFAPFRGWLIGDPDPGLSALGCDLSPSGLCAECAGCGYAALWDSQCWLPPAFSRRLEFLHFRLHEVMIWFVSGHGFSRAEPCERYWALAPGDGG